jgi:hypothetical protein
MPGSILEFRSKFAAPLFALALIALWLVLHGYHGITGDGQIYAFQALARLHPEITADLFLQNTSQDRFTLFSTLYASCVGWLGLENASRLLFLAFTAGFLAAAWFVARSITGRDAAWMAVALLLVMPGIYGAFNVFQVFDPFLTARLPAEALIMTALAFHVGGKPLLGFLMAVAAMAIHPLMALPGLIFLICMRLPIRVSVLGAIGGVLATLVIGVVAVNLPESLQAMILMDPAWLDVVRERSQFLFLHLWSMRDWDINVQPFISLAFTGMVVKDERWRKLCAAAALVGAAGLAVAFIGGVTGPVAMVVQGQGWRWVWIAIVVGALLVPVTALQAWRDEACGRLCVVLLISGWTLPVIGGTACTALALFFWSIRARVGASPAAYHRWLYLSIVAAAVGWISLKYWNLPPSATNPSGIASFGAQSPKMFGLKIAAITFILLVWWGTRAGRARWMPMLLCALSFALSISAFPSAFKQSRKLGSAADMQEFTDWRNAIPPTGAVLVAPPRDVGAFVWFTLGRPNYLSLDQSSGVVFSRKTALEVRRRSAVLEPLMDPNWKILSGLRAASGRSHKSEAATRPLTSSILRQICTDPQLGFVISPEQVGFDPVRHERAGAWKNWNLYDCQKVRSAASST